MFALVGMSCFLEINNIYSTNAFAFVLFCVLTRWPVYISLALNSFQNKILFSEKLLERGRFSSKVPVGGRFYKKRLKTTVLDRNLIFYSFSRLNNAIVANTTAHIYAGEEQILATVLG